MADIKIKVFEKFSQELEKNPWNHKVYECLKVMNESTLKALSSGSDVNVTFSRWVLKANVDGSCSADQSDPKEIQKWIDDKKLNTFLIRMDRKPFFELGYVPVVKSNDTKGGKGNERLYWLDIKEISLQSEEVVKDQVNDAIKLSIVSYSRADPELIKISLLSKLFFSKGELKNKSLRALALIFAISSNLIFWVFYIIVVALILVRKGQTYTSFDMLLTLVIGLFAWNFVTKWFLPIYNLPEHRVIKAPFGFLSINELDAEIEMYRDKHRNQITRFTRFTSVCTICTAEIVLREGKPDQKAPLVGRCVESPYDHVYSFDRVTLKGKYIGY